MTSGSRLPAFVCRPLPGCRDRPPQGSPTTACRLFLVLAGLAGLAPLLLTGRSAGTSRGRAGIAGLLLFSHDPTVGESAAARVEVMRRARRSSASGHAAGPEVSTMSKLDGQWCDTLLGTLPRTKRRVPDMPRLPTAINSALVSVATEIRASAGSPAT